jgi:CHAT domain
MLYEQAPQLAYRYRDFTIALRKETTPSRGDPYAAFFTDADGRQIKGTFSSPLSPTELSVAVASIRAGGNVLQRSVPEESLDPVKDMGSRLYDALFHGSLGRAFMQALDSPDEGVRLRLVLEDDDAAALPWEFLYDRRRDDFLVLSTRSPLVRQAAGPGFGAAGSGKPAEPLQAPARVLVAVADVTGSWDVDKELDALNGAANHSGNAEVEVLETATPSSFAKALRTLKPDLVHLIATGVEEGRRGFGPVRQRLFFLANEATATDAPRQHVLFEGKRLAELFSQVEHVRLVVINGCNTDTLAGNVASAVPATVAHRGDISDEAAVAFAEGFYSSLLNGLPLEAAVTGGRLAIDSRDPGGREWSAAVMYLQTTDGTFLPASTDEAGKTATNAQVRALVAPAERAPKQSVDREQQSLLSLLTIHQSNLDALNAQRERLATPPPFLVEQIETTTAEIERLKQLVSAGSDTEPA